MKKINLKLNVPKEEFIKKLDIRHDSPEEVRDKLETLRGKERLDKSAIQGLEDLEKKVGESGKTMAGGPVAGFFKYKNEIADTFSALKEPNGFENRTASDFSFDDTTRTLSVTTSTHYYYWIQGVRYKINATKTLQIEDTEGEHLIYFDTDSVLHEYVNPTTANILTAIRDKALVAYIYWDATNNQSVYLGEERHGCVMDGITHYYLHYTRGLQWVSGLGLGDFVIGDGSNNTHAQFSVATGSVSDEDIGLSIDAIASTTGLPILYRLGATGAWRKLTQTGYACYKNPSGTTNRLMYNQLTGGSWQLTEVGEGNYVLYHIFATTGKTNQIYSIMGQATYTTQPAARAGAQDEIGALLLGSLPGPEIRPIATVIFQTDKDYTNDINARVVEAVSGGDDYVDWRTNDLPRGTVPSDHGSLTGLSDDDHTQYALVSGTRTITVSATEPTSPVVGDIWIDTS